MSIKVADHPYFTRSKDPTDSFHRQDSNKEKAVTGDNNEEVNLTDDVVAQSTIADQNKLIIQNNAADCGNESEDAKETGSDSTSFCF